MCVEKIYGNKKSQNKKSDENFGMSFSDSLRFVFRQAPDVIFIGEVRDEKFERTAILAWITGHFVFATVHAGGIEECVLRIKELGEEISLLNAAIRGIVFQSLAFLSENSVPIAECVKSCFLFAEKSRKLESSLILTEERILSGWKISESFSKSFEESGLKNESRLLKLNLSLCQMTGKNDGFSKVARNLEEKSAKRAERFLGLLQPSLMFITAFYLWLLLKDIFLPVFMGIGGDL